MQKYIETKFLDRTRENWELSGNDMKYMELSIPYDKQIFNICSKAVELVNHVTSKTNDK